MRRRRSGRPWAIPGYQQQPASAFTYPQSGEAQCAAQRSRQGDCESLSDSVAAFKLCRRFAAIPQIDLFWVATAPNLLLERPSTGYRGVPLNPRPRTPGLTDTQKRCRCSGLDSKLRRY